MNVETGAEAALFPGKEYIIGIAVAVQSTPTHSFSIINDRKKSCVRIFSLHRNSSCRFKPFFCFLLNADELLSCISILRNFIGNKMQGSWVGNLIIIVIKRKKIRVPLVIFSVNMSNLSVICNSKHGK
jgi:hypothetical protein